MKHSFLDRYSYLDSPVHRLSAISKIIISLQLLIAVLAIPARAEGLWLYLGLSLFLALVIVISRIPVLFVLKRILSFIPFILLIIVFLPLMQKDGGLKMALFTSIRAFLSILVIVLLTSTTRFSGLLDGLRALKMPSIIIMMLSFIYRYFFILTDEMERLWYAVRLRAPRMRGLEKVNTLGRLVGHLFIHSYERSERIYQAMTMRGYTIKNAMAKPGKTGQI